MILCFFLDVTTGTNNDGDIQPPGSQYPTFCEYGFAAQAGWDPVCFLIISFILFSLLIVCFFEKR